MTPVDKQRAPKAMTPLWVISLFVSLTEVMTGIAATQTSGGIQVALTAFVIAFPAMIASAFFMILWNKPYVFYPPTEYQRTDVKTFVEAMQRKAEIQNAAVDALPDVIERGADEYRNRPDELLLFIQEQLGKLPKLQEAQKGKVETPRLQQKSILWVDDKPMNNVYESSVIKRLGASIVFARSTHEAIRFLERDRYDLVISDIHRDEDGKSNPSAGYELFETLSKMGMHCPFIFYTGSVARINKDRARGIYGAADVPGRLIDLVITALAGERLK